MRLVTDTFRCPHSATAVWREDLRATVTIKDLGFDVTPSVVAFNDEGERLVGVIAKDQQKVNPRNTVRGGCARNWHRKTPA